MRLSSTSFYNSFMEMKFACHKMHSFKVYNLMLFSVCRVPQPSPRSNFRAFPALEAAAHTHQQSISTLAWSRQPLVPTELLSISVDGTALHILQKWNPRHAAFGDCSFTQCDCWAHTSTSLHFFFFLPNNTSLCKYSKTGLSTHQLMDSYAGSTL